MRLTFLGTGNAFCEGGRANQSLLLEGGGERWLVDCGATTVLQMQRFGIPLAGLHGILLTHLHADHTLGVPMVLLTLNFLSPPPHPLRIVGPPGTAALVEQLWHASYPDVARRGRTFAVSYTELDGEARESAELGALRVETVPMRHSVPVNGYRILVDGRVLAVSGDTSPAGAVDELGRNADLLVVECNSLRPLPGVAHTSVEEHRGRVPYGARGVAFVHTGADVLAEVTRIVDELGVRMPVDGETIEL